MEVSKMILLLVLVCSGFGCTSVHGRFHYGIAWPPMVEPPSQAVVPANSISLPPALAPQPVNPSYSGNSSNSTSTGCSGNSTNTTSAHPPSSEPVGAGYSGNSTSSTSASTPVPSPPPLPAPVDAGTATGNPSNAIAVLDVRAFGAVGDGVADDTEAFKTAWDIACQDGPGTILVPQGYAFKILPAMFVGPCHSELTFQIDGTIMPPDGPDEWPQNNNRRQWLVFYRANGLKLQGRGVIDGRGEKWWNLPCKPHKGPNGSTLSGTCDSPVALRFFMSSNLTVHGIRVQNSPQFHFRFDNCRNVTVDAISISSPALSPNTDGIHVENTEMVGIYNSVISNGDDCVSIGAGSINIDIRNVTCGPSHGISIGSLGKKNTRACVTNITVKNSVIRHSDNGVRIKTWQGGSGSVSSVSFDNIRMDAVRNPIIIDQYYCLSKSCKNQTSAVYVSDVSYTGIKGTYDVRSPPIHFGCSDSIPCTNITLSEVVLLPAQAYFIPNPFCWNVYGAMATQTIPPISCLLEGFPSAIMDIGSDKCY
ncbi:hypothetical protein OPV22_011089 [Ensete ventricosum]|uniref:Pectate lyase superfamily protein domain-containing protein n=1 Tax=Ensete ventricosum TaxID=4639 RepID=A0AAV8RMN2_ENSVE|nr:hypothetical protein OPV22_011089 [Ensete ventricosum]